MNFKFNYNYPKNLLLTKVITGILLGLILAIYITQDQVFFKKIIYDQVKNLCTGNYNADFSIDRINLFSGKIRLKNLRLTPKDDLNQKNWSWGCQKITINFSWLSLLINHKIVTQIKVNKLNLNSLYQNQKFTITDHLYELLLAPSTMPIELKNLTIKTAILNINNSEAGLNLQISWSSNSKIVSNILKSNVYLKNGSLSDSKQTYLDNLTGNIQITLPFDDPKKLNLQCDLSLKSPFLDPQDQYFINAKWNQNIGSCKLKSLSGLLDFAPINLLYKNHIWQIDLKCICNLAILQKIKLISGLPKISGQCLLDLSGNIYRNNYSIAGSCLVKELKANNYALLDKVFFTFNRHNYAWHGALNLERDLLANLVTKWHWHETKKTGAINLYNKNQIDIPVSIGWDIKPRALNLSLNLKKSTDKLEITGTNTVVIKNSKTNLSKKVTGQINYHNYQLILSGDLTHSSASKIQDQEQYLLIFDLLNYQLVKATINPKEKNKSVISCCSLNNNLLQSTVDLELIHNYLPKSLKGLINGNGALIINSQFNNHKLDCDLKLTNGNLILPKVYNVIKDLTAHINYDFKNKNLKINDLNITLYQGKININQAVIKPNYIYLPILFNNLAINFERNLIANCAGKILYQNHDTNKHNLKGFIILEQTLCRYNLLSPDLINNFGANKSYYFKPSPNLELDLNFLTQAPIKIKSEFLDTCASAQIRISGQLINPKIIGQIKINNGKINFPYKPLHITNGQICFTGTSPDQATLDLTAKNNIKRHNITMQLSGPISNPQINLQSSPSLTSETIGALLLLGTDNSSLNMIMPAIVMQNLNHIVFGSIYDEEKTNHLIKKLFKPLDHVKFVPSFSDETGRGGLKGAIEIDVNDRLHALIQKNFSLTEDTKLEIDYAISDDVSIRAIKDERGDLGSELEIRFKI